MEPTIVERKPLKVMGVLVGCTPAHADFHEIWMNQFMARHDEVRPHSTDGAYYGLDYMPDESGTFEYVAGMAVGEVTNIPEGLVVRDVPAATDAVFECTVATIGPAYGFIHGEWLPASGYEHDTSLPGLEHYPSETTTGESPVLIHIPVIEKGGKQR